MRKQVSIPVPAGNVNLSSVMGTFEILDVANEYWRKQGNCRGIDQHKKYYTPSLYLN
jgi:hypothetical protein